MSQENVDAVKRAYERWNANDEDWADEILHEDVVFTPIEGWPEPGPFHGRGPVIDTFRRLRDDFGQDHLDAEEFIDRGDVVVVKNVWSVTGDYSGIEGEFRNSVVMRFRDGKAYDLHFYREHDDALAAAGAAES